MRVSFLISLFLSTLVFSSSTIVDRNISDKKAICSFSIYGGYGNQMPNFNKAKKVTEETDKSGIFDVINSMKEKLKINPRLDIYLQSNLDNAYALLKDGKRSLIFDVNFLEKVNKHCGSEWCAIQIIAHELGHHINGFSEDSHQNELGADYWSGYILSKLGASLESTLKGIQTYGSEYDTDTHPNVYKRSEAIEEGYRNAND